jgi:GT2 family glycosyltransferase
MAYKKSIFDDLCFEEHLQRFGGYALGEDVDLSHRVFLKYGEPLIIAPESFVVHHNAEGGRITGNATRIAAMLFNTKITLINFSKYKKYALLPFIWEQRIGRLLAMFMGGYRIRDIIEGYRLYRGALKEIGAK